MLEFPLLTERFAMTPLGTADRTAFTAYRRDPDVARFQSWTPDWSDADTDALIADQPTELRAQSGAWLQLAVHDRAATRLVGDVAVHALADQPDTYELGVTLAPSSQGVGAGQETLGHLVDALFRAQGAHRVTATTDARNTAAARLFQRLGFRHEGRAVDADWFKDEWTTLDTWAVLRDEHDRRSMPGIRLRDAVEADHDALVAVWRRAVDATHHFLAERDRDVIEALLPRQYLPAVTLIIAEANGRPVGFAGVHGGALEMLFVDPAHHGSGIGSALLAAAVRDHAVTRVDVNEQNTSAADFYAHRGFEVVGRSSTDDAGRPYPILHLELRHR
ncbi:acetyltransferase [Curtobacterium sp. SP.BCo]|uniref:acetyltransferase n=1 Tax=Curtobacterium sp. SP.BCo TaxID=3435229 RepID=UPI003F732B83